MTEPTDADRAKAAEALTALEWLRVTHADTLSGRRIEEAIAAERAAAVAEVRARVEAVPAYAFKDDDELIGYVLIPADVLDALTGDPA